MARAAAVPARRRQRGFAMIAIITLVTMVAAYLLSTALMRTSAEVRMEGDSRTREAMLEAKAALIAYAGSQAWNVSASNAQNDQPGALPCPATDEAGTDSGSCATEATRIGRLPWKTIGSRDLRDGSGNLLWYALSANFRKAAGTTIINGDTEGTLTITGSAPATKIVAVIIAPGNPVSGQNRSSTAIASYLEGSNANTADSDSFVTALSSDSFNDQIMTITQAELMAVVEPAVAARIESTIKPYLATYFSQWSAYPFPVTFFDQTKKEQVDYSGATTQTSGLLPLTAALTYPWTAGTSAVSLTGGTARDITSVSCATATVSGETGWRCSFTIRPLDNGSNSANWGPCTDSNSVKWRYCMNYPAFSVSVQVSDNAAKSFVNLPGTTAITVTSAGGAARSMSAKAISGAFTSVSGSILATVTFQGTHAYTRYNNSSFTRSMVVFIPDITVSQITSDSLDTYDSASWFIKQQWYRQTYYAVAPGFLPAGGGSCTAGTNCLTVSGLPSSYATPNDKRAILVFAGRALNGSARPSSTLGDYLEGENATPADNSFAHFASTTTTSGGTTSTVNDRVIVIAP